VTAWDHAVASGDVAAVRQLLAAGQDVDARDGHGQTALMRAAHAGHLALVEALVAAGAALDVTARYGLSALMLAIVAGHAAVARRLARAGASLALTGTGAPGFAGKSAYALAAARGDLDDLLPSCGRPGTRCWPRSPPASRPAGSRSLPPSCRPRRSPAGTS
jgi:serine/threonine-protein phosphatase 6 regulatory ankyrin repeat subunit B